MKRCSSLILSLVLLLFSGSALTAAETTAKQTNITCSAQSPVDGSLWMGTQGEGLLRMGRNGRHILYNKANGQLNSDVIKTLSFETGSNILFILDGNGSIWTYSSTSGFTEKKGFNAPVLCMQASENGAKHYAATEDNLYRFTSESAPEKCLTLPAQASKIVTGEDGSLWIITNNGAIHVDENLNLTQQEGDFTLDVSNSNHFTFETSTPQVVTERKASPLWLFVVLGILACAMGIFVYYRYIKSRRSSISTTQVEESVPETEPTKEETIETIEEITEVPTKSLNIPADKPGLQSYQEIREKMEISSFGASVLSVIDTHLDDPNFGVEQISETLGLSRIHLNRRLKAEAGFSPSTVLKAARMNQAVQFLMDGNHTIAEVAASCGFTTASYFSTAFKEYFGASPSDYINLQ
jgi:AraC-like DNA-binding protein